ncbi:hypothetical protein BC827DRAFT_1248726 [Russula dissimulans]|nr:hypothetical protein BC827DRAFT_1248726 [Russula dissimulans]
MSLGYARKKKDSLEALLDPQTGFAPRLRQLCKQQLSDIWEEGIVTPEGIEALRMECSTWALLQAIMPARKTKPPLQPSAHALLSANPYTPTSVLAQATMAGHRPRSGERHAQDGPGCRGEEAEVGHSLVGDDAVRGA